MPPTNPDEIRDWRRTRARGRAVRVVVVLLVLAGGFAAVSKLDSGEGRRQTLWVPSSSGSDVAPRPATGTRQVRTPPSEPVNDPKDTGIPDTVFLDDVVDAINRQRAQGAWCSDGPSPPLIEDLRLTEAARSHVLWMIDHDEYAHVTHGNPDGDTPTERARTMGSQAIVAENIAWGQRSPRMAVSWWRESNQHCGALMDPTATHVGVAVEPDRQTAGWVWVMMTGR